MLPVLEHVNVVDSESEGEEERAGEQCRVEVKRQGRRRPFSRD